MTDENCMVLCPWVEEDGSCHGDCQTIKPIETLTDEQIHHGKGSSLIIQEVE